MVSCILHGTRRYISSRLYSTRLMVRQIHVGTSGWSYDHWKGPFYPGHLAAERMLAYYAGHFRTTEINTSFYHLPAKDTLKLWYDTTPSDFLFTAKASRYITHMKKLTDTAQGVSTFLRRIRLLDDKLGPILFQLPPRWRFNKQRLAAFLDALSGEFRYAFEFRDRSWLNEETSELLSMYGAAFCIYELDGFLSPKEITSEVVYVRLHGPDGPYRGSYSDACLSGWAGDFARWTAQGRAVYCYFDNDENGYAARNAFRLQAML
jgi:uncharacterized protein YecE (DUF72 family)